MNILMVYPNFPETFWKFSFALPFVGKKASLPPMGLLTVASHLPGDWNLKLIDLNVSPLEDKDLLWADYVFISAMTVQRISTKQIIKKCLLHDKKIVAGGPLFTTLPDEFPEVTHLVLNEAEVTLPEFLRDLKNGHPKAVYTTEERAEMTGLPVPRWDLIKAKNYASMCIQYSRGCPFDCEFCDITVLLGRKPRTKTVSNMIGELEAIYETGWRGSISVIDDNFIGNKRLIKHELLPAIIKWMKKRKYPFKFHTQASVDLAEDEQLMRLMVDAGFEVVFVGIETPDENCLNECGKYHNVRSDLLGSVKKMQATGLQVQGGFIVGFDSDKKNIFSKMSSFINESGIVTSMVGLLNAPVGTKLHKRLTREGRLIRNDAGDNTDFSINFRPKMELGELIEGYKRIINDIYNPKAYYKRLRTFLSVYNNPGRFKRKFNREHARAIWMSLFKLGLSPVLARHFWSLMLWTVKKRPKLVPLALNLAIYSYQFTKYYEITK